MRRVVLPLALALALSFFATRARADFAGFDDPATPACRDKADGDACDFTCGVDDCALVAGTNGVKGRFCGTCTVFLNQCFHSDPCLEYPDVDDYTDGSCDEYCVYPDPDCGPVCADFGEAECVGSCLWDGAACINRPSNCNSLGSEDACNTEAQPPSACEWAPVTGFCDNFSPCEEDEDESSCSHARTQSRTPITAASLALVVTVAIAIGRGPSRRLRAR